MHADYEYTTNYAQNIGKSAINKASRRSDLRLCSTAKFNTINVDTYTSSAIYIYIYTGCHRRNGPNFGRVFLMLNYIDITQNTYIQS